jgi:demethoxyubiquinone hydroxylase (CLK1/Coq7/Cat5 family)
VFVLALVVDLVGGGVAMQCTEEIEEAVPT